MALAPMANAAIVLNVSDGNGTGPFGTVTLTQVDSNTVNVLVALNASPQYQFVDTGSHDTFGFNLLGSPAVTFSNITAGFYAGTGFSNGFAGTFTYSLNCSSAAGKPPDACANGASSPAPGPLSFNVDRTVGNLSVSDFIANASGFTFAADVFGPSPTGGNFTGLVESRGTQPPVPEPITSSLVGTGLIGLFFLHRRTRR